MKQHRLSSGVTAKFDLTMEIFDEGDAGLLCKLRSWYLAAISCLSSMHSVIGPNNLFSAGRMEYCTALYDPATIERWSQQYVMLLGQMCQLVHTKVQDLDVMPNRELRMVQSFSMGEERPEYLNAPMVHEAFAAVASETPDRRCLCHEGEWLSYGEVAARVVAFAGRLAGLGIGPGVVVGLMLDRSFELVVSILAVMKAGGCYLPCDPSYPDDRLAVYLEDAKAALLLVQAHLAERAAAMVGDTVPIVDVADPAPVSSSAALQRSFPEDPVYIIFTSGSTGRPKGVTVAYRGLRDLVPWLVDRHGVGKPAPSLISLFMLHPTKQSMKSQVCLICFCNAVPDDVVILTSTFSFDAHVLQVRHAELHCNGPVLAMSPVPQH